MPEVCIDCPVFKNIVENHKEEMSGAAIRYEARFIRRSVTVGWWFTDGSEDGEIWGPEKCLANLLRKAKGLQILQPQQECARKGLGKQGVYDKNSKPSRWTAARPS